jgi:hypothetical protein
MFELFTKTSFPQYFYNQFIETFTIFIIALILGYKRYSPFVISVSMIILYFYSYFIHRFFHELPESLNRINVHTRFHHNVEENKGRFIKTVEWFIELFVNIMFFVLFYFIQKFLRIDFVPEIIIFYYGFIYVTVHVINYSLFHSSQKHVFHHTSSHNRTSKIYNYGPDFADHIFATNSSTDFENYDHVMPNGLIAFLITYYLYKPKII